MPEELKTQPEAKAPLAAKKASFSVKFQDTVTPLDVTSMFVLPKETVDIEVVHQSLSANYRLTSGKGTLAEMGSDRWRWAAPTKPGAYALTIVDLASGQTKVINAFVMVPIENVASGKLDTYRIGNYPDTSQFSRKKHYQLPRGFVKVTPETRDVLVSPHFTLGQFLCKQQPKVWPKYVVLDTQLPLKLEMMLQAAKEHWSGIDTFTVMSGYRTPWYNRAIGNVRFSRHVFGDAADVFIDRDGDGRMDDLNGDGKSDYQDARQLGALVEDLTDEPHYQPFLGGLGQYGARSHRGPFVHVDVRGYRARWNRP